MASPLVSLIVPFYNIAHLADPFFDSLLRQPYTALQLIFVNDGSADNIADKIAAVRPALEEKGFRVDYIYQENRGLGGAINTGLKRVEGKYLCWADPDDYFEPDAFTQRVAYMEAHPECHILTCDAYVLTPDATEKTDRISTHFSHTADPRQFEWLLHYDSIFTAGCYMLRTASFRQVNPQMDIFEARRGQNWQMLLPMYYAFERTFLPLVVYNYIAYPGSMSHSNGGYADRLQRIAESREILLQTLDRIQMPAAEREKYREEVETQILQLQWYAALSFGETAAVRDGYRALRRRHALTFKDFLRKWRFLLLKK